MNQKQSSLPNDVPSCHDMIHQLGETVGEQQREVEQLKHFIERLLRQRFGARSEKIAPNQMSLFDEPDTPEEAAEPEDDDLLPRRFPCIGVVVAAATSYPIIYPGNG